MADLAIRVVSLQGSPRRAAMTAQLAPTGCDWAFFDAFDGQLGAGLTYRRAHARRVFGRALSPGELGCFASHHALWAAAARDPAQRHYLVLEDDVRIDPAFLRDLDALVHDMAAYAVPLVRLAAMADTRRLFEGTLGKRSIYRYIGHCWGTQGYILSPDGARQLHAWVRRVERPVDNYMDMYWRHGLPNRVVVPFVVHTCATPSILEDERSRMESHDVAGPVTRRRLKCAMLARHYLHGAQTRLALRWGGLAWRASGRSPNRP